MATRGLLSPCFRRGQVGFSRGKAFNRSFVASKRYSQAEEVKAKHEGDISSVFRSLSGDTDEALPARFSQVKGDLVSDKGKLHASWVRLLERLREENEIIKAEGTNIIPEINFSEIDRPSREFNDSIRRRGVAVIRGVVPHQEARAYKEKIEAYVKANPWTKAFPAHDPQVFEIYWSKPQIDARTHPNVIAAQRFLMQFWHSKDENAAISIHHPLIYADRVRIRQPGDSGFALGPHVDGGSVERWERNGYGKGRVFDRVFEGTWEEFDPWESGTRLDAVSDLYGGSGACSMFRMFQGWLGMSSTAPGEGTLLVNPLFSLATAYYLLRPFFTPRRTLPVDAAGAYSVDYLDSANWYLEDDVSSMLHGAFPGHSQELNHVLHPHLDLPHSMIHIPKINPGDYVAWHCDTIHAVDRTHRGNLDSSVMYIPACPTTKSNLDYLKKQRDTFFAGTPPPDFPGGKGESEHNQRADVSYLFGRARPESLSAFGMEPFEETAMDYPGQGEVLNYANKVLGFGH